MAIRKDSLQHRQAARRESSSSSLYGSSSVAASDYDDNASASNNSFSGAEDLGVYDVICGRDKQAFNSIGNRRFRVTISLSQGRYLAASTRKEKSAVIKYIADLVRSNGGRFLQRQDDAWVELSEKQAHEKVGHALRDMAVSAKAQKSMRRHRADSISHPSEPIPGSIDCASAYVADAEDSTSTQDAAMEPIPWMPSDSDKVEKEPALDDGVLSWLLNESDSILHNFEE